MPDSPVSPAKRMRTKGPPVQDCRDKCNNATAPGASSDTNVVQKLTSTKSTEIIEKIIENFKCPITKALLVEPVVAEDGRLYEKAALEAWLSKKKTSPITNQPMGTSFTAAVAARQTVGDLVDGGVLDEQSMYQFFTTRGEVRALRNMPPGPDLAGSLEDFERARTYSLSGGQSESLQLRKKVVTWMHDGVDLFTKAKNECRDLRCQEEAEHLKSFLNSVANGVQKAVLKPSFDLGRIADFKELAKGTRVWIIDDAAELRRLCSRPAPGAQTSVQWSARMESWAGKVGIVESTGPATHKNYSLHRESPAAERSFSFPYDALAIIG